MGKLILLDSLLQEFQQRIKTMTNKSYEKENDPISTYCREHSSPLHPAQIKLQEETLKLPRGMMLGAPEVLQLNSILMKSIGAKKVLDIGVFTGASALAAALAIPEDGRVLACDVSEEWTNLAKVHWENAGVKDKINLVIAPALETLQKSLDNGEAGTYDFAFIDADKGNYVNYHELVLKLLRVGGMIAYDNTLLANKIFDPNQQSPVVNGIRAINDKVASDSRVTAVQLNIGDGLTLVTKN